MTVAVWAVVVVLLGHWFFDFVLQPNWMGQRKSKEWWVLTQHSVRILLGGLVAGIVIKVATDGLDFNSRGLVAWAGINAVAHFAIDAVTSRMTTRFFLADRRHAFFVTIGFDQFLHLALAIWTLAWLVPTT